MEIIIRNKFGWKLYKNSNIQLWFSGYLIGNKIIEDIAIELALLSQDISIDIEKLSNWANNLSGHFALVVKMHDNSCFLAVDKICSIPVYYTDKENKFVASNYAPYLKKILNIDDSNMDLSSLLEISMSGFSIGNKTIYHDINRLMAGECIFWNNGKKYKNYYYTYSPQEGKLRNYKELKSEFTEVCLTMIKNLIKSVNGRQIVVQLSAGNDSRLIASGLKELGYKNVICFTYGRSGNYEVESSKKIANLLGYKWVYVQDTISEKHSFFKSRFYDNYVKIFESYASVPNTQDIYEIYTLKTMNIIDSDAVIVNGNSGDFISGGHVPEVLELNDTLSAYDEIDWELFLDKHYSIWRKLRTRLNDAIITSELSKISLKRLKPKEKEVVFLSSIMESMELIGRQSRLVANQQRAYDFIGHEWRLPLWSEGFLDFWEKVPVKYKVRQLLYKEVLMENNWGGVWKDIDVNNKLIRPYSLYFSRLFLKSLFFIFGKYFWHKVDKNVFSYWIHPSCGRAISPYLSVLFDLRGQRNINSWTADQFIRRNGFKGVVDILKKIKKFKQQSK
jgi:asparagine synthase (glutamine-hydrolysing)